jgi:hypothetical protein
LGQVGAADHLFQPEVPTASDPPIEAVQEFRLLETARRHSRHNAVQVSEGAHPKKYLLVFGSSLPSQMIWSEHAQYGRHVTGVVEMLIKKLSITTLMPVILRV